MRPGLKDDAAPIQPAPQEYARRGAASDNATPESSRGNYKFSSVKAIFPAGYREKEPKRGAE